MRISQKQGRVCKYLLLSFMTVATLRSGWSQDATRSSEMVKRFGAEKVFFKQIEVGKELVTLGDANVLADLLPLLDDQDRHVRANAAYVFEAMGDDRGFNALREIVEDTSCRPIGQGIPGSGGNQQKCSEAQVRSDRYYAVHIFGELRDAKAVGILIPLLSDESINYKVPWALGQIGDKSAVQPLIQATYDSSPDVRVGAIHALVQLNAKESLPRLHVLLNDNETCHLSKLIPVSQAASEAISKLSTTH